MTHLMRNIERKVRLNASEEKSQSLSSDSNFWSVLEPPCFTIGGLCKDLHKVWNDELKTYGIFCKIPFMFLRVLQHIAYRRGYGNDQVSASLPPIKRMDFSQIEKNLGHIQKERRNEWMLRFLAEVNKSSNSIQHGYPKSVVFELSATCNFNCVGCECGRNGIDPDRFMRVEDLRIWGPETCREVELIRINGLGEATLHPEIQKCVEILKSFPGGREIITNGSAPPETMSILLENGYVVLVSWDAGKEDVFTKIRRGANFDRLRTNLIHISKTAERNRCVPPVLLFTLRANNISELSGVVAIAAESGFKRVTVNVFRDLNGSRWAHQFHKEIALSFEQSLRLADELKVDLAIPDHVGYLPIKDKAAKCTPKGTCIFSSEQVVIRFDGTVTPCNMLNPYIYGELKKEPFSSIWNSPSARLFRVMSSLGPLHPYCDACQYVHGGYEETKKNAVPNFDKPQLRMKALEG